MSSPDSYCIEPIGVVHSCYREKFGIPRQPGLVDAARAVVELDPRFGSRESVEGLEAYSHIWILFVFHETAAQGWKPQVRPPRLGGNKKMGVYATRSMFRPNPIGQSVVKLDFIEYGEKIKLHLSGIDLLDQTPVLDVKPYIPYVESIPDATAGSFQQAPLATTKVTFCSDALLQLEQFDELYPELKRLIEQILEQDPRPAYHKENGREYGIALYDLNICWIVKGDEFEVLSIESVGDEGSPTSR
ncbi:MAG: tRNA (N6-threonylcarbamoyladenosine(37)-N6)-methyltransferase TrmO [Gammaproteobacteria bacterium]|nr:tRNA (N6-threonylcarbamoyladenosine(37)-N6)-methyltransferase TrmO [Gammaproteobacteria bacterium]